MRSPFAVPVLLLSFASAVGAQTAPHDLWTPELMQKIRDPRTLNLQVVPQIGYVDIFFDSEVGDAKWADSEEPYTVHTGGTIRIHGYLAAPAAPGAYPAIVIGHGHGGSGSAELALAVAALGYVALSIDGPMSGLSTGGPRDTEQAWISVEEPGFVLAPEVSYLYHYAYAGMRALTALEALSTVPGNPFRVDRHRLGVAGASMGGQFTYYINGVDSRVKAAVGIAVAGDWRNVMNYEGAWLFHGLYYYTRDGWRSGVDALNTIAGCDDPTLASFESYFDPIRYAPTQHAPLLTIVGTHDYYFVAPSMNTTYDRVQPADPSGRFAKRLFMAANGKHEVIDNPNPVATTLALLGTIDRWLKYAFDGAPEPPPTPSVTMTSTLGFLVFRVRAAPGAAPLRGVRLFVASQMDSTVAVACDFVSVPLVRIGAHYFGFVPAGQPLPCGPPVAPGNVIYYASVSDASGFTVSSKLYYRSGEMTFGSGFVPAIEHWRGDDFPVPPAPMCSTARP